MFTSYSPKRIDYASYLFLTISLSLTLFGCAKPQGGPQAPPPPEVVVDKAIIKDVQLYINTRGTTAASQFVEVPARVTGFLKEMKFKPGDIVQQGQPLFEIESDDYIAILRSSQAQLDVDKAKARLAKANLVRTEGLYKIGTVSPEDYDTAVAAYEEAIANIARTEATIARAELNVGYTKIYAPVGGKTSVEEVHVGNLVGPNSVNVNLVSIRKMDPIYVDFDITNFQFNDVLEKSKPELALNNRAHLAREKWTPESTKDTAIHTPAVTPQKYLEENKPSLLPSQEKTEKIRREEEQLHPQTIAVSRRIQSDEPVSEQGADPNWNVSPRGRGFNGEFSISLMNRPNMGDDVTYPYSGKITLTDNQILSDVGTIRMRGEIANPDYVIFPGQICRVRIPTDLLKDAILVREEAINFDLNTTYVLIVDAENKVRRRNVVIGELVEGRYRVITTGLRGDETYIHQGIQRAKIDDVVTPITTEEYEKRFSTDSQEPPQKPSEAPDAPEADQEALIVPKDEQKEIDGAFF